MGKKSSYFGLSTGNEVSRPTGGGVVTHGVQGRAYFASGSFNVLVEGEPAVRHLDLLTFNHTGPAPGNTPPAPVMSTMSPSVPGRHRRREARKEGERLCVGIVTPSRSAWAGLRYRLTAGRVAYAGVLPDRPCSSTGCQRAPRTRS